MTKIKIIDEDNATITYDCGCFISFFRGWSPTVRLCKNHNQELNSGVKLTKQKP